MSIIAEQIHMICVSDEHREDLVVTQNAVPHGISGIITDCSGNPLKDVCVKAVTLEYEPIVHTVTAVDGTFSLIIEQAGKIQLIFSKNGYATLQLPDFFDANTVCDSLKVFLNKQGISCLLSGRLVYGDCKPAASVRLQLTNSSVNQRIFSRSDGRFLFSKVPSGKYTLTITGNSCKKKSIFVTVPENLPVYSLGTIGVEWVDIMCTVHGIITDACNCPIENAVVALFHGVTRQPVLHTLTNENGLYFFGGVKEGCYYVEAYY